MLYRAYLGYRTLCDSRDNPTVLSLESVPVQDVPFPAVSFHPHSPSLMMKPSAKHLEDRVLRSLEFDCTMRDARCMEMSSKLRKDLGWAIRHVSLGSKDDFQKSEIPTGVNSRRWQRTPGPP